MSDARELPPCRYPCPIAPSILCSLPEHGDDVAHEAGPEGERRGTVRWLDGDIVYDFTGAKPRGAR